MTTNVDLAWAERELLEVASVFRQCAASEDEVDRLKEVARRFVKTEEAVKARSDYDKPYYAVGTMPVPEEKCPGCGIAYARTISHRQDCPELKRFHEQEEKARERDREPYAGLKARDSHDC